MSGDGDRDGGKSKSTELPMTDLSAAPGTVESDGLLAAIAKAPAAAPPRALEAGTIVGHGFRIERRLGAGGMGVVYLARDLTLERDVALKVHRAHGGLDRLQREAVAMARLAHPNVITVHEIGRVGDRLFVAMEYVSGQTLRDWLASAPRTWRDIVAMMRQAGEGLCAAHDAGLVHRDFKPENVLVGADGRPRVGDFGLVRVVGGAALTSSESSSSALAAVAATQLAAREDMAGETLDDTGDDTREGPALRGEVSADADTIAQRLAIRPNDPPRPVATPDSGRRRGPDRSTLVPAELTTGQPDPDRLTATGTVLGTPAYMAPEQFAGERVDARADQFAFSIVLYEALYGQRPFAGKSHGDLLRSIEDGQIRVPPAGRRVPRWLRRVYERGLAARPDDRFASMRALLEALDRGIRRRTWIAVGAALAAAAALSIGTFVLRRPVDATSPCASAGADLDAIWSPASHARLTAAATAADAEIGPRIASRIAEHVDEFARDYRQASARACVAREVEESWDDDLYRRSRDCLTEDAGALRSLLSVTLHDRRDLGELLVMMSQLPSADRCARPSELARAPALPHGLVTGVAANALFRATQEIEHSHDPIARRRARLDRVAAVAHGLDSGILDARIALARAGIALAGADLAAAQVEGEKAFALARAAGDDDHALIASILMLRTLGVEQTKFEAARMWQLQVLADAGRNTIAANEAYLAAGAMAEHEGHYDQAIEYTRKAIAILEERHEADGYDYAFALDQLAAALDEAGHAEEAITWYQKAIALNTKRGGADNPSLFNDYVNLSLALSGTGDTAGGIEAVRRALALAEQWKDALPADSIATAFLDLGVAYSSAGQARLAEIALESARAAYRALPGDQRDSLVIIEADLALVHQDLHRYDQGLVEIQDAIRIYKELGLDDSADAAQAQVTLGGLYAHTRRCPEAVATFDDALTRYRRVAPDRVDWVAIASAEAACQRTLGRAAASVALLESALAALVAHPWSRAGQAGVEWELAQGLHALGRDPARARELAISARAAFEIDGPDRNVDIIVEIDRLTATWP